MTKPFFPIRFMFVVLDVAEGDTTWQCGPAFSLASPYCLLIVTFVELCDCLYCSRPSFVGSRFGGMRASL